LGSLLEIKIEDDPTEVTQEPKQSKKSKYQPLLKNPDVNRWYHNMMREAQLPLTNAYAVWAGFAYVSKQPLKH
jgi:hypothetical protein